MLGIKTAIARGAVKETLNAEDAGEKSSVVQAEPVSAARALRAHRNANENIMPFAFLGLIYVLLALVTRPIGWALSHLIIAVLFYALITPLGLLRRLLGRDPLALRAAPGADSYWAQRPPPDDGSSYLRQS